jgi:GntR family transcriptional regulator
MTGNTRRVDLDPSSPVPLYQQVAEWIRTRIEDGRYPSGGRVPSLTDIQGETSLSLKTIQKGMGELEAQGYVIRVSGKGTYVTQPEQWPAPPAGGN